MKKKDSFGNFMKRLDMLGPKLEFTIKGKSNYQTYFGGICTIFLTIIIIVYGAYKLERLFGKKETT